MYREILFQSNSYFYHSHLQGSIDIPTKLNHISIKYIHTTNIDVLNINLYGCGRLFCHLLNRLFCIFSSILVLSVILFAHQFASNIFLNIMRGQKIILSIFILLYHFQEFSSYLEHLLLVLL